MRGFVVRKTSKAPGFRVLKRTYIPKEKVETVLRETWPRLGFHPSMSLDEAKKRASQLNLQGAIDAKKMAGIDRRLKNEEMVDVAYLPSDIANQFEYRLRLKYKDYENRIVTVLKHWSTAKTLIRNLQREPVDFFGESDAIFQYYISKKWSPDYAQRITSMMNSWGVYYSAQKKQPFNPIPNLDRSQIGRLYKARKDAKGRGTASKELTLDLLLSKEPQFADENLMPQFAFILISFAFGLRPSEVDGLRNEASYRIEYSKEHRCNLLWVFQPKLIKIIEDEKKWKAIAVILPEQKRALEIIQSKDKNFKRPLTKTLHRIFGHEFHTYAGRKGFTDHLLSNGFALETISSFLGHQDISMTWKHYKQKTKFEIPEHLKTTDPKNLKKPPDQ